MNVTGRVTTITLPQAGIVTYAYSDGNHGIECADGGTATLQRSIAADAGSTASTWTYKRTPGTGTSHTEVTDGLNNHLAYDFVIPSGQSNFYETNRAAYQGPESGTPVLARQSCYNGGVPTCTTTAFTMPVTQVDTWETLDGIQTHGSTLKYNGYGLRTEADLYDFASSATSRGSLLKEEVWTYSPNIPDLVAQDAIYDGSQTLIGNTIYTYDGTTPTLSSGVPQHISVTGARGNLTGQTVYANATTSYGMSATYEDTGSILTNTTPDGTSQFSYDPTFVYLTTVQLPTPSSGIPLQASASFESTYTGTPSSSTDLNGKVTSYPQYDSMLRPTTIQNPDGGSTIIQYPSANQRGVHRYQNSTQFADNEVLFDGYARQSRTAIANGQTAGVNWYQQDICYDANGRPEFASYSYQAGGFSASKVCTGSGDSYLYDVLGRMTQISRANGEIVHYIYFGRDVQYTDEGGVSRIVEVDGLGRTKIVCEISSHNLPPADSPVSCGTDILSFTGYRTTFSYTLATHSTTISQGSQTRTFQTDWLGRTVSITEPESGTTAYSYSYNGTGLLVTVKRPRANQSNPSVLTTSTYQYDSLSRLVSASYDDGTPARTLSYDASANWSDLSQTNLKGHVSLVSVSNAKTIFSYDVMGRVTDLDECLPSGCGNTSYNRRLHYTYDWIGDVLTSTDGGGVTSSYVVSPASEQLSLTSSLVNSSNPANTVSNVVNGPNGIVSYSLGNGLAGVNSFDSLGRMSGGWLCSGGSTPPLPTCTGGSQVYGFTTAWNGDRLTSSVDSVLNQSSTYGYDDFNRLTSRTVTSGSVQNYSYVYDRYGNRLQQNITAGSGPNPVFTFVATTNQITPGTCNPPTASQYCYDAAGNMIADGFHTYTFDAEGNITAVDTNAAQYNL